MDPPLEMKELVMLSIATSIDALAVGVTLSFMETNIWLDIAIIGVLTFFIAGAGVFVGNISEANSNPRRSSREA